MKLKIFLASVLLTTVCASSAFCSIQLAFAGDKFDVQYSAMFEIEYLGGGVFDASLTNTTDASLTPQPLVQKFAWNMVGSPKIGDDFTITDVSPSSWKLAEAKGGVLFDYVGGGSNKNRLGAGEQLTFKMNFVSGYIDELDPYSILLDSDTDYGRGFGGGDVSGQAVVHFQQLGDDGEGSDLLGGNWSEFGTIPEPTSVLCWSLMGVCGFCLRRRKQSAEE